MVRTGEISDDDAVKAATRHVQALSNSQTPVPHGEINTREKLVALGRRIIDRDTLLKNKARTLRMREPKPQGVQLNLFQPPKSNSSTEIIGNTLVENFKHILMESLSLLLEKSYVRAYKQALAAGVPPKKAKRIALNTTKDSVLDSDPLIDAVPDRPRAMRSAFKGGNQDRLFKHRHDRLSHLDQRGAGNSDNKMIRGITKSSYKKSGRDLARQKAKERDRLNFGTDNRLEILRFQTQQAEERARQQRALKRALLRNEPGRRALQSRGPINIADVQIDTATGGPEALPKGVGRRGMFASTQIIGNTLVENFKKVCWGKRYR